MTWPATANIGDEIVDNAPAYPSSCSSAEWAIAFVAEYPELAEANAYRISLWFAMAIAAGYDAAENGIQLYDSTPTPHRHY